jgi:hypothetical protein
MPNLKTIKLSHEERGFEPGDDDKLQEAMHKNLRASATEALAKGDVEHHQKVTEHINALNQLREEDSILDPNDENPDHPHGGHNAPVNP